MENGRLVAERRPLFMPIGHRLVYPFPLNSSTNHKARTCHENLRYPAPMHSRLRKLNSLPDRLYREVSGSQPRKIALMYLILPSRGAKYCDQPVCMSVCLLAISQKRLPKLHEILRTCYLWPRLGSPLMTMQLRYVLPVLRMTSCFT